MIVPVWWGQESVIGVRTLEVEVGNPADPDVAERVEFAIDGAATYSTVPTPILHRLGIKPLCVETFRLADGSTIIRKRGAALLKYKGRMSATDVLFGQRHDRPVLGALALESLGFAPTPTNKRLPRPTAGRNEKMGELLSLEQIYERFPSEWVLLEDPETTDTLQVKRGAVLCHSKDRDEVYRVALEIKPRRSAILYTGKLPEGTAIAL